MCSPCWHSIFILATEGGEGGWLLLWAILFETVRKKHTQFLFCCENQISVNMPCRQFRFFRKTSSSFWNEKWGYRYTTHKETNSLWHYSYRNYQKTIIYLFIVKSGTSLFIKTSIHKERIGKVFSFIFMSYLLVGFFFLDISINSKSRPAPCLPSFIPHWPQWDEGQVHGPRSHVRPFVFSMASQTLTSDLQRMLRSFQRESFFLSAGPCVLAGGTVVRKQRAARFVYASVVRNQGWRTTSGVDGDPGYWYGVCSVFFSVVAYHAGIPRCWLKAALVLPSSGEAQLIDHYTF